MIRDGKRSITRELIQFMELIDEMLKEIEVISVKNVRFGKKIRASGCRVFGNNNIKITKNLKNQFKNVRVSLEEEEEVKTNPRKAASVTQNRIQSLLKSQRVDKSQPKVKKNVRFDENGNVFRLIKRNYSQDSSDDNDIIDDGDDEVVEEIGVSSKETEVEEEEDSSEMSENENDPRKNLQTRISQTTQKSQPEHESDENDDDEEVDDRFVFSAPLPAKMEYRVDSVNKKQTAKQ